jgi:pyruvate/2-oxoglutarate dehydrogenase complex dihydrolipoamide acyltransferase (E2) component
MIPRGTAALLQIGGVERRVVVKPATERVAIRARRILALVYDARHIAQPEADSLLQHVRVRVERHHRL